MARLDDLLPELKDDATAQLHPKKNESIIPIGKKRRAWLVGSIEEESESIKGSIDRVYNPLLRMNTSSVSAASKGSINPVHRPELCFADLRSNPLQLFRFLFESAQREDDNYKTPRIKIGDMMLHFNMSKDSARTALRFLLKQKFIERIEFQPGSLGWSKYQLNEDICKELERGLSKGFITPFVTDRNSAVASVTDSADLWDEIDFGCLESIGFDKKHLLQLRNKTTPEVAQESINHFAYSLKYNKKTKEYANPLATLIAVLKRGEAWIEQNYQSPQEIAQIKILEARKAELERKKSIEEDIYKIALEEWKQTLSSDEIESLAPDLRKRGDPMPPHAKLSIYFKEKIWPEKRKDYLI